MFFVALTILLMFLVDVLVVFSFFYFAEQALIYFFPGLSSVVRFLFAFLQWFFVVATVLHVVNRDMVPESKIPWILCIVVLNVFGVAIYAVFSNNRPSRRQRRQFALVGEQSRKFLKSSLSEEDAAREMGRWAYPSRALSCKGLNLVYDNTKTEYFPSGESFFSRYLEDLKGAKQYIFMEYFILARGKMWDAILEILQQKVKEGVEVRVVYDDIGCMGKLRAGYYKKLRKMGIECRKFNPFVPVVSNFHNNRDHRKITVIDGKIGYTGGLNLADEYINETHPFGYWKDAAIRLEGEGVRGLLILFLRLFNIRRKEPEDFSPYFPETYETIEGEGYVQPYGGGPKPLYEKGIAENLYLDILAEAKRYVYIMTPYLIIDYRLRSAMISAAARGVDVRIVVPHIPDKKTAFALTRSNYLALIKGGVKVYEFTPGFIHAKNFLADDDAAVVGTINLDYRSLMHHYENAVFLYKTKANEQLKADFEETFEQSALQTEEDAKKSVVWRGVCEIAKVFAPLF